MIKQLKYILLLVKSSKLLTSELDPSHFWNTFNRIHFYLYYNFLNNWQLTKPNYHLSLTV